MRVWWTFHFYKNETKFKPHIFAKIYTLATIEIREGALLIS